MASKGRAEDFTGDEPDGSVAAADAPAAAADPPKGSKRQVWCAYSGSEFVLFGTELAALRYAAVGAMKCQAVQFGVPLGEQLGK